MDAPTWKRTAAAATALCRVVTVFYLLDEAGGHMHYYIIVGLQRWLTARFAHSALVTALLG